MKVQDHLKVRAFMIRPPKPHSAKEVIYFLTMTRLNLMARVARVSEHGY